jgi:fucose 4-O-acetylase-like acetyltransferase
VDYLKVVGILAVVANHAYPPPALSRFNSAVNMPIFLFVAGFLTAPGVFNAPWGEFFQKRIRRLLQAYVLLALLVGFLGSTNAWGGAEAWEFWGKRLLSVLYSTGSSKGELNLSPISLWFMPAMLSALLLTRFVYQIASPVGRYVAVVTLGVVAHFITSVALPWELETACAAVVFVVLGHELRKRPRLLAGLQSMPAIVAALVLTLAIAFAMLGPRFDFRTTGFASPLWTYPRTLLLLAGCALVAMRLPPRKEVRLLAAATLLISAVHLPLYWRLDHTVALLTGLEERSFLAIRSYALIKVIVTVGLLLALYPLARWCLPFIFQRSRAEARQEGTRL